MVATTGPLYSIRRDVDDPQVDDDVAVRAGGGLHAQLNRGSSAQEAPASPSETLIARRIRLHRSNRQETGSEEKNNGRLSGEEEKRRQRERIDHEEVGSIEAAADDQAALIPALDTGSGGPDDRRNKDE
jgi:hypothetical protein